MSLTDKYASKIKPLKGIPGIGVLTGMEILVELQDLTRFKTAKEVASYMGPYSL